MVVQKFRDAWDNCAQTCAEKLTGRPLALATVAAAAEPINRNVRSAARAAALQAQKWAAHQAARFGVGPSAHPQNLADEQAEGEDSETPELVRALVAAEQPEPATRPIRNGDVAWHPQ
jgi:hypothetical protein